MQQLNDPEELNTAMWCHLSGLLGTLLTVGLGFVGPLIILCNNKKRSAFIDFHAKQSLNHQLTFLIIYTVGALCFFFGTVACCVGVFLFFPLIALWILSLVFEGIAASQASNGEWRRIPMSIPFVS